jgi:hypothetical protein
MAISLLAAGRSITDTAEAIEVTRQTVSAWVHHHPGFQAALNSRRQELWADVSDRLRGLLPKALDVIEQELLGEAPLSAAVHILKACRLYGLPVPQGPIEPEELAAQEQERANRRKQRLRMANILSLTAR